jgi:YfiH family protein
MIIQSENLKSDLISHAFFTKQGGVSTGLYASLNCGAGSDDDPEAVLQNKQRVCAKLGIPKLKTLYQVHSSQVVVVDENTDITAREQADAMVSNTPGIALGILTADCVPILFADPVNKVIGAAHSGWKGTLGNIAQNVIAKMISLGAERATISVAVGPAIQQASYEVGPEFPIPFMATNEAYKKYFKPSLKSGHHMFDLTGLVRDQIAALEIKNVELMAQDTYTDEHSFFSYRRMCHREEPDYGRQISAIALQV